MSFNLDRAGSLMFRKASGDRKSRAHKESLALLNQQNLRRQEQRDEQQRAQQAGGGLGSAAVAASGASARRRRRRRQRRSGGRVAMNGEGGGERGGGGSAPTISTSPLSKWTRRERPPPSTASTAHSDAFNAPLPVDKRALLGPGAAADAADDDEEAISYTDLFKKYGSHVRARAHLQKIEHARGEQRARGFEDDHRHYYGTQASRATERVSKAHGPMSKDEGGFRVPCQPRVSPLRRQRALQMGTPVSEIPVTLDAAVKTIDYHESGDGDGKGGDDDHADRRDRSTTADADADAQAAAEGGEAHANAYVVRTSPIKSDSVWQKQKRRAPKLDEHLAAYDFDLSGHSDRRSRRRAERTEKREKRTRTSMAREWRRDRRRARQARREQAARKREARLVAEGHDPQTIIPEYWDDGKDADNSGWLRRRRRLSMSREERQAMHRMFDTTRRGFGVVVDISSARLGKVSSDMGRSTLQLQMGLPVLTSVCYSANHAFQGQEFPAEALLALTWNQRQKSSRKMRRGIRASRNDLEADAKKEAEVAERRRKQEEARLEEEAEKARQADPYGKNEERTLTEEEKARLPPPVVTASQRDRPLPRAYFGNNVGDSYKSGQMSEAFFAQCGLVRCPESLGKLTGLRVLDLHSNRLTSLPDALVKLSRLRVLDVSYNQLERLPAQFGRLAGLEFLNCAQNKIAYLPDGIHQCSNLKEIRFQSNTVMVMGVFPVPAFEDTTIKSWQDDDLWERVDGLWWGCVYKNTRTGTLRRRAPTGARVVDRVLSMQEAKTWTGELNDVPTEVKARNKSMDFNALKAAGAPMYTLRLCLRNTNRSEWEVGIDANGDTYYETCLKDPGKQGEFLNRQYDMPKEMDRLGKMGGLEVLHMSMNGVRTIPFSIGTGPLQGLLKDLRLDFNRIRDLPGTLCKLRALQVLYLGNNKIERLPRRMGDLQSLTELRVHFNKLTYLPESMGSLTNLHTLWVNNNALSTLPHSLGNATSLTDLKCLGNAPELEKSFDCEGSGGTSAILWELRRRIKLEETGPPPAVILAEIGVGGEVLIPQQRLDNQIAGEINSLKERATAMGVGPEGLDMRAMKRKKEAKARHRNKGRKKGEEREGSSNIVDDEEAKANTALTLNLNWLGLEEFPEAIGSKLGKRVRILHLVGNKIPRIPQTCLAPLGGLLQLNLNANGISELPDCFGKMRYLEELHLAENNLTLIPHSVLRLRSLRHLDCAHNAIDVLQPGIGRMKALEKLNLASNVLTALPPEFGNATTLRHCDLSANRLVRVPEEAGGLFRLRKLNLNCNKLKAVPETFANLSNLKSLLLMSNRIRSLPSGLGSVVDVAAEYARMEAKQESAQSRYKAKQAARAAEELKWRLEHGFNGQPQGGESAGSQNAKLCQAASAGQGGNVFAELFVQETYQNWQAIAEEEEEERAKLHEGPDIEVLSSSAAEDPTDGEESGMSAGEGKEEDSGAVAVKGGSKKRQNQKRKKEKKKSKRQKKKKRKRKKPTAADRRKRKGDNISPYFLLTGMRTENGLCSVGDAVWQIVSTTAMHQQDQKQQLPQDESKKSESNKPGLHYVRRLARGIVVDVVSSTAIVVRSISMGDTTHITPFDNEDAQDAAGNEGKTAASAGSGVNFEAQVAAAADMAAASECVLFERGKQVYCGSLHVLWRQTKNKEAAKEEEEGAARLGKPKTCTQHQHQLLTLHPIKKQADDDDDDNEEGGYIGRFCGRLARDQNAWLEQRKTGAVGRVIAAVPLNKVPILPGHGRGGATAAANASASKDEEAENQAAAKLAKKMKKARKRQASGDGSGSRFRNNDDDDDEPKAKVPLALVTVCVLLLSRRGMFDDKSELMVHTNVLASHHDDDDDVVGEGEEVAIDVNVATGDGGAALGQQDEEDEEDIWKRRHTLPAPMAVKSRVQELMLSGAELDVNLSNRRIKRKKKGSTKESTTSETEDETEGDDEGDEEDADGEAAGGESADAGLEAPMDDVDPGMLLLQASPLGRHALPAVAICTLPALVGSLRWEREAREKFEIAEQAWQDEAKALANKRMKKRVKKASGGKKSGLSAGAARIKLSAAEKAAKDAAAKERVRTREAIVRVPCLVLQGRLVRRRAVYAVGHKFETEGTGLAFSPSNIPVDVEAMTIGRPTQVRRVLVDPPPTLWDHVKGAAAHVGSVTAKLAKKGVKKGLVKWLGEARYVEIEEKAAKAAELAAAMAVHAKEAAVQKSIQLKNDMAQGAKNFAKGSQALGRMAKNLTLEVVTGKYQISMDDLDDDDAEDAATKADQSQGDGKRRYDHSSRGMLLGGMKSLTKTEVLTLMEAELTAYEERERRKEEEEAAAIIKNGGRVPKKSRKQRKEEARRAAEREKARPLIMKPSPLASSLSVLRLSSNRLTEIPESFSHFGKLKSCSIDMNPILSPPADIASMGISHMRAYFRLRSLRLSQLHEELTARGIAFHKERFSPQCHRIIHKDSRGHLTKGDLKAFDAQCDKLVNGQILLFRFSARKIVRNFVAVKRKREHWYHQKILQDFLVLLGIAEEERLAHADSFLAKEIRPWGQRGEEMRCFVVALDCLFEPWYGKPISIVNMVQERHKLGYDRRGFDWTRKNVEEAAKRYKGIWRSGNPEVCFEEYRFEDCVADASNMEFDRLAGRMVPVVSPGGVKRALVIKRVLFSDEEVKRKLAEDREIRRFADPKLYRLCQWFRAKRGSEKLHAMAYEKKGNLREDQSKAQQKAEESATVSYTRKRKGVLPFFAPKLCWNYTHRRIFVVVGKYIFARLMTVAEEGAGYILPGQEA